MCTHTLRWSIIGDTGMGEFECPQSFIMLATCVEYEVARTSM